MDKKPNHNLTINEVLQSFSVASDHGLSNADVRSRHLKFGPNVLPQTKEPGLVIIFLQQFLNPLIYVLLIASCVALYLHEWHDALFIFIVLGINASIGAFQEYSAQRSAQALRNLIKIQAKVLREGKVSKINAEELVPGDIVLLESGDKVPADMRLVSSHGLEINESLLTGESAVILKNSDIVLDLHTPLADQKNMAFMGTLVTRGRGRGIVVSTGLVTQLGKLAYSLLHEKEGSPPLLIRMERFTKGISIAIGVAVIFLMIIQAARGVPLKEIFFSAIALAVSAIPEGLPIAITVALAVGMRRMAKRQVIIRRLLAVESLGSCTFIASDKTGTLTMNELSVGRLWFAREREWTVSGVGVIPEGSIGESGHPLNAEQQNLLMRLCRAVVICNEGGLDKVNEEWIAQGDSVDVALLVLAHKAGVHQGHIRKTYLKTGMIPFEPEEQFAAFFYHEQGHSSVAVKGALEKLLAMSSRMATIEGDVQINVPLIERQAHAMAAEGFRVLAVAEGQINAEGNIFDKRYLKDLTFLGLVGMIDPLRPEARSSIQECQKAGIHVGMVTGDHPTTALVIARELGLAQNMSQVVTGPQLVAAEKKGIKFLDGLIAPARVFARVEPRQKLSIVQSLARQGHFVAVTGDGANDAPALRGAHVGVAMGKRGTDVARESASIILTNDDFSSIVGGIEEGRIAYANVRKVIFLLVSTGAAEIILFTLAVLTGLPLPLLPTQLLWLNLVTNGIQDVALAFEPGDGEELKRLPRHPQERIFDSLMVQRVLLSAAVISVVAFWHYTHLLAIGWSIEAARNSVLLLMVLFENMHIGNCRSENRSFLKQNPLRNPLLLFSTITAQLLHIGAMYTPGLRDVLGIQPVSFPQWSSLLSMAMSVLVVMEIHKIFLNKIGKRRF